MTNLLSSEASNSTRFESMVETLRAAISPVNFRLANACTR